jgi:nucleotidyltransferase/DNA polymerase involved in DNA repair
LKERIFLEPHLTATIGVATNKLLAKIASDHKRPDGLTLILERGKVQFLRLLPACTLYGIGKATEEVLHRTGVETAGDRRTTTTPTTCDPKKLHTLLGAGLSGSPSPSAPRTSTGEQAFNLGRG